MKNRFAIFALAGVLLSAPARSAINPANIATIPTIAAMQALGAGSAQYGTVQVQSYTSGNVGGGTFQWYPADASSPDSCRIFAATGVSTGRWHRIYSGNIDITQCGATTAASDNSSAINNAIASAGAGGTVVVPTGTYLTAGNHSLLASQRLIGPGTLKLTASNTNPIVRIATTDAVVDGVVFDLSNESSSGSSIAVIIDGNSVRASVRNNKSLNGQIIAAITNGGSAPQRFQIINNTLNTPYVGSTASGAISVAQTGNNFLIQGNGVFNSTGAGIAVQSASAEGAIADNIINSSVGNGIFINTGNADLSITGNTVMFGQQSGIGLNATVSNSFNITLANNISAFNIFDGFDINEPGSANLSNLMRLTVTGNVSHDNGYGNTGAIGTGMYMAKISHATVSGNILYNNNQEGLFVNSGTNVALTNNDVFANGVFSTGHTPGIHLTNTDHSIVNANISTNNGAGTATQTYGILADGTSDYNVYTSNVVNNNTAGTISTVGSNNTTANNITGP